MYVGRGHCIGKIKKGCLSQVSVFSSESLIVLLVVCVCLCYSACTEIGQDPSPPRSFFINYLLPAIHLTSHLTTGSFNQPEVGQHTVEILRELNHSNEVSLCTINMNICMKHVLLQEVERLLASNTVYQCNSTANL